MSRRECLGRESKIRGEEKEKKGRRVEEGEDEKGGWMRKMRMRMMMMRMIKMKMTDEDDKKNGP